MLFNSYEFLLLFLPVTAIVFYGLGSLNQRRAAVVFLLGASLFFYGYWNPHHLPHILVSMAFNFLIGQRLLRTPAGGSKRLLLGFGVTANLLALGYFKYYGFILENVNRATDAALVVPHIELPLAISFFTFTQIAYLVDSSNEQVGDCGFVDYSLFVTTFPHLIAGPIVHHGSLIPQLQAPTFSRPNLKNISVGLTFLAAGLGKKVLLADQMGAISDPIFALAAKGLSPSLLESWVGSTAYVLQLYFDFSGYSDMAIGLGLLFNLRLPINFASPYKSANISELWRRWHITLTDFLRQYLYTPLALAGVRRGIVGTPYLAVIVTMTIAGLWHGAGWTFVLFGLAMGVLLSIHTFWQSVTKRLGLTKRLNSSGLARVSARLLTMICVVILWALFRSQSVSAAGVMIRSLAIGDLSGFRADLRWSEGLTVIKVVALMAFVQIAPNTQWFLSSHEDALPFDKRLRETFNYPNWLKWQPNLCWAFVTSAIVFAALVLLGKQEALRFIYFQF